jgi:hypothetical protein
MNRAFDDAGFETGGGTCGIPLQKHLGQGLESVCHFIGDTHALVGGHEAPRGSAGLAGEGEAHLLESQFSEFDLFPCNGFSESDAARPLEGLIQRGGPGGPVGEHSRGNVARAPGSDRCLKLGVLDGACGLEPTLGRSDLGLIEDHFGMGGEDALNDGVDGPAVGVGGGLEKDGAGAGE